MGDFNGDELLFPAREKDVALMSGGAWKHMGATPFQDDSETLERFIFPIHANATSLSKVEDVPVH